MYKKSMSEALQEARNYRDTSGIEEGYPMSYDEWLKKEKGIKKGAYGVNSDEHAKYSAEWRASVGKHYDNLPPLKKESNLDEIVGGRGEMVITKDGGVMFIKTRDWQTYKAKGWKARTIESLDLPATGAITSNSTGQEDESEELTEGRVILAVDKKSKKKWQFSGGMIVKYGMKGEKEYDTEGVTMQQVLELSSRQGDIKLGKKDVEAGFASGTFSVVDDGRVWQPWKNDFEPEGEQELTEVHWSNKGEPPAPKGMHKLRSGRDVPSSPQVDKIHKKVIAMTDRNDHSGARIELAKQVGDKQLAQVYSALELIHDKYSGAVGNKSIELRHKFEPVLNNQLDRKFGKYADVLRDAL